jgi:hypothetical protein
MMEQAFFSLLTGCGNPLQEALHVWGEGFVFQQEGIMPVG